MLPQKSIQQSEQFWTATEIHKVNEPLQKLCKIERLIRILLQLSCRDREESVLQFLQTVLQSDVDRLFTHRQFQLLHESDQVDHAFFQIDREVGLSEELARLVAHVVDKATSMQVGFVFQRPGALRDNQ